MRRFECVFVEDEEFGGIIRRLKDNETGIVHMTCDVADLLNFQDTQIKCLKEDNEQLHHELQQINEYLQTKIDECKNPKKMKEIVFGVEQKVGYEKALLQFQKGLRRRLNDG